MMFKDSFWRLNGFEELKKHIRQGADLTKDICSVLQERASLEAEYSKCLSKLGAKLSKATGSNVGTLAEAWGLAGTEMEAEAEAHKQLATGLVDDVCKQLKLFSETQSKTRKPIEATVDKSIKVLLERRAEESKLKKSTFGYAHDLDKTSAMIAQSSKDAKSKDKDAAKLEKKMKQLEESLRKGDREYYECCKKAELSRQEWESTQYKACEQLQELEEERIAQLQDSLNKYNTYQSALGPRLIKSCDKLREAVLSIDPSSDLRRVVDQKQTGPNQPEQILPDFYAEDKRNAMDVEGRKQALQNYLLFIQKDLEMERNSREGLEKLVDVYRSRPAFADPGTQFETLLKLAHVNAMIRFFEAAHSKVSASLAENEGSGGSSRQLSHLMSYIERSKDKQGNNVSTLRIPMSMIKDTPYSSLPPTASNIISVTRSPADGGHISTYAEASVSPPPYIEKGGAPWGDGACGSASAGVSSPPPRYSTFSVLDSKRAVNTSFSDDEEFEPSPPVTIGRCTAIYNYNSTQPDELTIQPGDVIAIFEKMADGWWHGELCGRSGIFPATYVKEL